MLKSSVHFVLLKINYHKPSTWILPLCWMVIGFQGLFILQIQAPEFLRWLRVDGITHHLFASVGLLEKDPLWELSRDDDRSRLKQTLKSIDKYSTYLSEDQFESFSIDSKQEYEGIGVSLQSNLQGIEVRDVFDGGPAAKAGIEVGDIITGLDGKDVRNWTFGEIVEHIRGHAGTVLRLELLRGEEAINIQIKRDAIGIPSVRDVFLTPDGIIYLKIDQFGEKTAQEFVDTLKSFINQSLKGLVIDLRENSGGIFLSSLDILDAFYPKGDTMLETRDTQSQQVKTFKARRNSLLGELPTVILVNHNSASASEIVAGSLQVTGKALIIGEKTLGKGSIQTVFRLREGDGYKKTTSYYYFPDGSTIHEKGIDPDVHITLSGKDYFTYLTHDQQGVKAYSEEADDPYWIAALQFLNDR